VGARRCRKPRRRRTPSRGSAPRCGRSLSRLARTRLPRATTRRTAPGWLARYSRGARRDARRARRWRPVGQVRVRSASREQLIDLSEERAVLKAGALTGDGVRQPSPDHPDALDERLELGQFAFGDPAQAHDRGRSLNGEDPSTSLTSLQRQAGPLSCVDHGEAAHRLGRVAAPAADPLGSGHDAHLLVVADRRGRPARANSPIVSSAG